MKNIFKGYKPTSLKPDPEPDVKMKIFRATRDGKREQIPGLDYIPPMVANPINISSIGMKSLRGIADVPLEARTSFNWADINDVRKYKPDLSLPSDFISPIRNQGLCGSCWAVSTATCFSDRWAIANKISNPQFSPTFLLSCAFKYQKDEPDFSNLPDYAYPMQGCNGGYPSVAQDFISKVGISTDNCWNYDWCKDTACWTTQSKGEGGSYNHLLPPCPQYNICSNYNNGKYDTYPSEKIFKSKIWSDVKKVQVPDVYYQKIDDATQTVKTMSSVGASKTFVAKKGNTQDEKKVYHDNVLDDIKEEIFKRGPVVACFDIVYPTFFGAQGFEPSWLRNTWIDDIYIQVDSPKISDYYNSTDGAIGGHAVVIVGWGVKTLTFDKVPGFLKRDPEESDREYQRVLGVYKSLKGMSIPYWVVRNSWGDGAIPNHTNGYFKMAMSNYSIGINLFPALDVPKNKYGQTYGGVNAMLPELSNEVAVNVNNNNTNKQPDNQPNNQPDKPKHLTHIIASGQECGIGSGILPSTGNAGNNNQPFYKNKYYIIGVSIVIILILAYLYYKSKK